MCLEVLLQAGGVSAHGTSKRLLACVCTDVAVPVRGPVKGLPAKWTRVGRACTCPHLVVVVGVGGGVGGGVVVLLLVEGVLGVQWG